MNISISSGSVTITGNVKTVSGSVQANSINGSVKTVSGNISK